MGAFLPVKTVPALVNRWYLSVYLFCGGASIPWGKKEGQAQQKPRSGQQEQRLGLEPRPVRRQRQLLGLDDRAVEVGQAALDAQHRLGRQAGEGQAAALVQAAVHRLAGGREGAGAAAGQQHRAAQGRAGQQGQRFRAPAAAHQQRPGAGEQGRLVQHGQGGGQAALPGCAAGAEEAGVIHGRSPRA